MRKLRFEDLNHIDITLMIIKRIYSIPLDLFLIILTPEPFYPSQLSVVYLDSISTLVIPSFDRFSKANGLKEGTKAFPLAFGYFFEFSPMQRTS